MKGKTLDREEKKRKHACGNIETKGETKIDMSWKINGDRGLEKTKTKKNKSIL